MVIERVVVIGGGIGGLVAALRLAVAGCAVTLLETAGVPGGKMRSVPVGGTRIEAGPTVFTMRWILDEIFAEAGADLGERVALSPARILARHAWSASERLDLLADVDASADAIAAFAGAREAEGYRRFCARAEQVFRTLDAPFIRGARPGPVDLARRAGLSGLGDLWRIQPFATLWGALGDYFRDPRLRQLFARYATYCGSSPYQAPATLMLVAHVEQAGVWSIEGGLSRLAAAVAALARERGATIRTGAHVARILVSGGAVSGVVLADGERIAADAVVMNGDVSALAAGLLGPAVVGAADPVAPAERSLSAITFCLNARTAGFPLAHHTVFFGRGYRAEFDAIRRGRLPPDPTTYVCAQDRAGDAMPDGPERLLCLVNAPARGERPFTDTEIDACETTMRARLTACGLTISAAETAVTTPARFGTLFPATGGALYGRASHGWSATFKRMGARTRLPGLYLAGGSVHPGPGVPMAAQSGRIAADTLLADRRAARPASTRRSAATAMSGGTSTP
ncbi:1-hydroxycarotenoid 3,4-desaturase CrtD [Methylobacterium sp. WL6]|uniref:1-hydroxycarotenoid 3,4-desaturase CrtD n=1 Tax=Methylobacterium sp. WL6 TaxID=2603901 RepID=UPI0011C8E9D0|nr:1-hydroxycarotenoid 3,4-desaturase CrtD [Methylobacterium sp. WL6]TXN61083.1 phytoene desaturase [Methylobacterium sp. WL6]